MDMWDKIPKNGNIPESSQQRSSRLNEWSVERNMERQWKLIVHDENFEKCKTRCFYKTSVCIDAETACSLEQLSEVIWNYQHEF